MGYDCTLHVIDEDILRSRFVQELLEGSTQDCKFNQREDAQELWKATRDLIEELDKETTNAYECASTICQLAIAFAAAELPYHYERGFCLALWEEQEEGFFARFPKKHLSNPESIFNEIVDRYPQLKGKFPSEIESNFCPGYYIPADNVPNALKWVRRKVKSFSKPNQRLFRGLLLVLESAAEQGLAYWEGTDLPVPMKTLRPADSDRSGSLEEWKNPEDISMELLFRDGDRFVFTDWHCSPARSRTVHVDINQWPPKVTAVWKEYAVSAAKANDGKWLTVAMNDDHEYLYRARLRESTDSDPSELLPPDEREHGLSWAGFYGDNILAVLGSQSSYPNWDKGDRTKVLTPAYILIQEDDRLVPLASLPHGKHEFPCTEIVHLGNDEIVFIWEKVGYQLIDSIWEPVYRLPGRSIGSKAMAFVPYGEQSFFYLCETSPSKIGELEYVDGEQGLFLVGKDNTCSRHLPKVNQLRCLSAGPNHSVIVREELYQTDLGKIYFPEDETYIRLERELFDDEDPNNIDGLHYLPSCERLIAVTSERIWSLPISEILSLPRYNANTGRKRRKKV